MILFENFTLVSSMWRRRSPETQLRHAGVKFGDNMVIYVALLLIYFIYFYIIELHRRELITKFRSLAETHATWKRQCIDVKPRPSSAALHMHASNFEPLTARAVELPLGVNNWPAGS